jgi:hypothetical protein
VSVSPLDVLTVIGSPSSPPKPASVATSRMLPTRGTMAPWEHRFHRRRQASPAHLPIR